MDKPLKVLLVDDEPPARRWLTTLLSAHPGVTIVGEAGTVAEAVEQWKTGQPDVVFLDIQMPPENGFDLLPHLQPTPWIVFVTAHDTYAVRAFEADALDYLLKPVHPERLAETLRRIYSAPILPPRPATTELAPDDFVPIRTTGLQRIIRVRDIALIEAEGAYTKIAMKGHSSMLMLRRLGDWEEILPATMFSKIDRSTLINLSRVRGIRRLDRDRTEVELEGAGCLVLHRIASQRLKNAMEGSAD